MNEKLTLFFGKTNPELSNLYVAPIKIGGKIYNSTEHYFMYQKAMLFDPDGDAVKKIGNDLTPSQVKKLGRQVKNFDSAVWAEKGLLHMFHALTAKFTQHLELKELLLSTGYTLIGEASPFDRHWGVGLGVSKPGVYDPAQWKGTNWMGALLMAVRGSLRHDTSLIGDRCWFDGDKLFYQSEVGQIEDGFYICEDGKVTPNWSAIIDRFYHQSIEGYKDMADLERHFTYATIIQTGVLSNAYGGSINLDDMEETE